MDDINVGYERLAELQVCYFTIYTIPWFPVTHCRMAYILSNQAALISHDQVKKVNGVEVENLKHLCSLVEGCTEENLRFDLDDERVIVLKYQNARLATSRVLKRHRIPSAISSDLVQDEATNGEVETSCTS